MKHNIITREMEAAVVKVFDADTGQLLEFVDMELTAGRGEHGYVQVLRVEVRMPPPVPPKPAPLQPVLITKGAFEKDAPPR